jgi:hypothetical protein
MPTSRSGSPIRVSLGAPKSSEQSNKQSALALALLAKTPLDYPISLSAAGLCRSRLSRRQSLLDPAAAPPSFLVRVFSGTCMPLHSPFRLVAPILRSTSWRLYSVPPRGAIQSGCLLQTLRVLKLSLNARPWRLSNAAPTMVRHLISFSSFSVPPRDASTPFRLMAPPQGLV